jgi:hypothetical protein
MDNTNPITLALVTGDLSVLSDDQRSDYYQGVCESLGLNPLTKPFEYLTLNGKLRLYALRDCTDQLRRLHGISIYITNRERVGDIYIVTARAKDRAGREDESTGAVPLGNLKGDALANALMKSETKAKRRVTLSIAGLGWLDETEIETIPLQSLTTSEVVSDLNSRNSRRLESASLSQPTEQHPTADEITTLVDTARAANVSLEGFGHDMRRLMQLPDGQKITKKFLREHMTMDQYNTARQAYGEKLRLILEEDVPNHEPPATSASVSSQPTPAPSEETPAAVPSSESPSAPGAEVDTAERDQQRLRQEVAGWQLRISDQEKEHVIRHNSYSKARQLLWKVRVEAPAATPMEAAAD